MQLILYGHDACPLCDRLEALVAPYGHPIEKRNIKDNRDWLRAYRYRIPVLVCGDRVILEGNPSEDEVARAFSHAE